MIDFLIKSTTSLAVLLVFYHLLLKKEKMYRFNRYYLLSAIVFSLAIPFITIPVYVEVAAPATPLPSDVISAIPQQPAHHDDAIDYWPLAIWALYLIGTLIFAARFVHNIVKLKWQAASKNFIAYKEARLVLLGERTQPFTFLNYIFVSREDYEEGIEQELFSHELAHVNQRHTLDVLFTEIVLIMMWYNPLMYFYKHAIQLNHEFLADDAVVNNTADVRSYQRLLLGKMSPPVTYSLVSSLNFSLTKTRFIMMTKATSRAKALLLQAISLPLLACIILTLCTETVAQEVKATTASTKHDIKHRRDNYYSGVQMIIEDKANSVTINKPYEQLTEELKDKYLIYAPEPYKEKHPTAAEYERFKNKKGYALRIDGKNVDNSILEKYKPADFAYYTGYTMNKAALTKARPQIFHYQLYTHPYFEKNLKGKNAHYPDKVFKLIVTKEFKDDKIVAPEIGTTWAEAEKYLQGDNVVQYSELDTKPEYPGGMSELYRVISKNYKAPGDGLVRETVYVVFTIEEDGRLTNFKPLKATSTAVGESVRKAFPLDVKWIPGTKNNKPVSTKMQLPVRIHME